MRSAFTLLEVVIASAILAVVMALCMQALTSYGAYFTSAGAEADLRAESKRITQVLLDQLGASAWLIAEPDPLAVMLDPALDRGVQYYPYVQTQTSAGLGTRFTGWKRAAAQVVHTAQWDKPDVDEWLKPSQELIFTKVARSVPLDQPNQTQVGFAWPSAGVPFTAFATAQVLPHLLFNPETITASLRFESNTAGELREYGLVVVPNSSTGRNELQLRYLHRDPLDPDGKGTPQVLRVISSKVDRILVETARTRAGLSPDQISVTIFLREPVVGGLDRRMQFTVLVALRSTVDPSYSRQIDNFLGAPGGYPVPW